MKLSDRAGGGLVLGLLALLPVLALAPAWWEARLLGPGDGAVLHYPLKVAVWESWARGELPSWNPWVFCGTPLLAAYRPGALHPLTLALTPLPAFLAFQVLVLLSLSASGLLVFAYVRRLGGGRMGAYLAGLCFALGPYLVGHLGDTPTLLAAPSLPLILLAAEAYAGSGRASHAAALSGALALLLLAGSPEAAGAGLALAIGRLAVAHVFAPSGRLSLGRSLLAVAAGLGLAAPQLLPTLLLASDAGRQVTGLAGTGTAALPGVTGLILRYVSHTPAPMLALAALPLVLTETPIRVLGIALGLCLGLQWGRGPLAAPGALALVFDLTLAILAGLSLSAQWAARREALGRRLRAYFLFSCLASAAALSVSAAALGPLPQTLAGAVGILALALILHFSLAEAEDPVLAGVWLLPLTVAFLLQPHGRQVWEGAPTRATLEQGTATRQALDRARGPRADERTLTLTRTWPTEQVLDLGHGNLGLLAGRPSATGYEPLVPMRVRTAFDGASVGGSLPGVFFRSEPARLEAFGIRWLQVPSRALVARGERGLGERVDLKVEPGRPRFLPAPLGPATELRLTSHLADAVGVPQDEVVAQVSARLASGRRLTLPLRAGRDTGEWAHDRSDVRGIVKHERPPVFANWAVPGGGFRGHDYLATLALPGRYNVDGIVIERVAGAGQLVVTRVALFDARTGQATPLSLVAGFVSDSGRFREVGTTPGVRLIELPMGSPPGRVVERLSQLPDDEAVLRGLRQAGFDPRREALGVTAEMTGVALPAGAVSSTAKLLRAEGGRMELLAAGPGLLVVAEGWEPGWSAVLDGAPARLLRVNQIQMGIPLPGGFHRVALRHHARGLLAGLTLAALSAAALLVSRYRSRTEEAAAPAGPRFDGGSARREEGAYW